MKKACFLLILCLCLGLVLGAAAECYIPGVIHVYMYVRTNGGHLNVRSWPSTSADILGTLSYGQQILVSGYAENRTWAQVVYNGDVGYVLARYLSESRPGRITPTPRPYVTPTLRPYVTPTPVPYTPGDNYTALNQQFARMARLDYSYTIATHPARIGGFVNLRWAPSTEAAVIRYCYEGEQFTVICMNDTWAQVWDNTTGHVGFLMRTYAY